MTFSVGAVLLVLATCLAVYALCIEPLLCVLETVSIPIESFPAGMRILFLTDMHHHRWGMRERSFLRCLPKGDVDLIVYGGDFLGSKHGIHAALRFVNCVRSRYPLTPMYAVSGNAEHKLPPRLRLEFLDHLCHAGVVHLANRNEAIVIRGTTIAVIGTDDPYYGFHDLDAAFSGGNPDIPKLLITHSPQVIRSAIQFSPDIVLCGHTHGGQVRIPYLGAMRTQNPLSRTIAMGLFSPGRLATTLNIDDGFRTWLYISRGLGLAFVPHIRWLAPRFLCRPEVSLLVISR